MKILTTGAASGIGKYISEHMGGRGFTRDFPAADFAALRRDGCDVIIHCAFNPAQDIRADTLYSAIADNVLLTERLLGIPHKKFIFFSSIDVYPKNGNLHREDEVIPMDVVRGMYAVTKLMSEALVRERGADPLILRCAALLGPTARKNSLMKILSGQEHTLTLSADSRFNYVLYSDILEFIRLALDRNLSGIYNAASRDTVTLSEIADQRNQRVRFGDYRYDAGDIDTGKIAALAPAFYKTSRQTIEEFCNEVI